MSSSDTGIPGTVCGKGGARLRTVGLVTLLAGVVLAGARFWMGSSAADSRVDLSTPETSKKVARDVERDFGKMGLFSSNLMDDLRDPGTQAALIAGVSILVAAGCFYVAHL